MFIKNETLENLKNVFETTPEEFVRGNLDSMLLTITEKAKQIKLSEL
jgi:intein-encoded DNA endonuclease-like protein